MKVIVFLADGFEDIEALTVVDILRRAGIDVHTVGVSGSIVTSRSNVKVMADKKIGEINPNDYDAVVLPGGTQGVQNLGKSLKLVEILKDFNEKGKLIAAICAAPSILAKIGLLENKRATIYPGMEKELPKPRAERVVVDGNIITSQGPGTAMEFALTLVEKLAGKSKAIELRKHLVI
jgi:4-methyl-5(b-hydroxyethyl)-thiazole monophosphate biosynthesis